jgi:transcription elongation factor Elf1
MAMLRECAVCGSEMHQVIGRRMVECELCGLREELVTVLDDRYDLDEFDEIIDDVLEVELVSV